MECNSLLPHSPAMSSTVMGLAAFVCGINEDEFGPLSNLHSMRDAAKPAVNGMFIS